VVRKALLPLLLVALVVPPAQTDTPTDPEIAKGIAQVDDGDYDGAILTLDNTARRLAADPKRSADLSQAYLYLGIAYIGKGHEAAGKAKFREAIAQIRTLSLSPDKFPPKVIDIFEAAKAEENRNAPVAATTAAGAGGAAPKVEPKKGGGGGKALLIIGGVAAAGGIAAVAAGGGSSAPTTTTTTTMPDPRKTESFGPITLRESEYQQSFDLVVVAAGVLEANDTWTSTGGKRDAVLGMYLADAGGTTVANSNLLTNLSATLTANVQPLGGAPSQEYRLYVFHRDSCDGCTATFNLTVKHP
jgi:hypothetical protein